MSTENVTYKITGEDSATSVFNKVQGAIAANDKSVNEWAKNVGKGARITGQWGQALSGLPLDSVGQQVAQLAGQFENLNKMKMAGVTGSLLFKAGIIGMVTAVAFEIGNKIHDWIYGIKEWREQLEKGMESASKTADLINSKNQKIHAWQIKMNEAQAEPADRERAHLDYLAQVETKIADQEKALKQAKAEQTELVESWANYFGYAEDATKVADKHVEIEEKRLKALKDQREELKEITGARAQELKQAQELRAEIERTASVQKSLQMEILALTDPQEAERQKALEGITNEERRKSVELLLEQKNAIVERQKAEAQAAADAIKAEQELTREREKAAQEMQRQIEAQVKAAEQQQQTQAKYLENLELELLALQKGKDAADEKRASLSGVSDETIAQGRAIKDQIAAITAAKEADKEREKERLEKEKALANIRVGAVGIGATESRLMTRGSGVDNEKQIADNTKEMVKSQLKLQMQQQQAVKFLQQIANNPAIVFGGV